MENEFVPYELALRMKRLGFDESCFAYYKDGKITGVNKWDREDWGFHVITNKEVTNVTSEIVLAPLFQQAFRWFREKHQLWFRPDYYDELKEYNFQGSIHKLGKYNAIADIGNHETPEEAELACLEKLIEIVENK